MAQFRTDREPSFAVGLPLLTCQILRPRSAGCRCRPSGEIPVADLCILVSMAVDAMDARRCALVFEAAQLFYIVSAAGMRLTLSASALASSSTWRCSSLQIGISWARPPLVQVSFSAR